MLWYLICTKQKRGNSGCCSSQLSSCGYHLISNDALIRHKQPLVLLHLRKVKFNYPLKIREMKKLKFLLGAMAMVATMSLVSCSNVDDPQPDSPEQPLPPQIEQPLPENPEVTPH